MVTIDTLIQLKPDDILSDSCLRRCNISMISQHCQTIINVWVNFVYFDKYGNMKRVTNACVCRILQITSDMVKDI